MADPFESGKWKNNNCGVRRLFVCEVAASENPTTIQPPTITPKTVCSEAYDDCIIRGGRLSSIHSENENMFVLNNILGLDSWIVSWIGFKRDSKTDQFQWADGSDIAFQSWGEGGKWHFNLFIIRFIYIYMP